jgi:hypothetical protein
MLRLGPLLLAFYDGAADVNGNFEERCGLAVALQTPTQLQR